MIGTNKLNFKSKSKFSPITSVGWMEEYKSRCQDLLDKINKSWQLSQDLDRTLFLFDPNSFT